MMKRKRKMEGSCSSPLVVGGVTATKTRPDPMGRRTMGVVSICIREASEIAVEVVVVVEEVASEKYNLFAQIAVQKAVAALCRVKNLHFRHKNKSSVISTT
ncbi:hypothetical protein TYRP_016234 [Tyrophagus putrescentiae]|nr:hypothetical protein TYRP_016234 [Tyrophagus putrescentiae]